jgi:hypothetical protein
MFFHRLPDIGVKKTIIGHLEQAGKSPKNIVL